MTEEELNKLLIESGFTPEQMEQWRDIIPEMEASERKELGVILTQQKHERDILATRQAVEVSQLMREWQAED